MEEKVEQQKLKSEGLDNASGVRSFGAVPFAFAGDAGKAGDANESGHEAGKDYANGELREDTSLWAADLAIQLKESGTSLYFKKGGRVRLVSAHPTNFNWVQVTGSAFYMLGKNETSAGEKTAFILREKTTMTIGAFKDIGVDDQTSAYGKLGSGTKANPQTIILHETDSSNGKSTKDAYASRIKNGGHVGAQYLIDESGAITLVVPANEVVGHVRGNKPKKLTKPIHKADSPEWSTEMKKVRAEIEQYFQKINTVSIPESTRNQLLSLSDVELAALLDKNGWTVYKKIDNSSAIGIEVVGAHKTLFKSDPGFSESTMAEIFKLLNSKEFELAPALKAQLLKTGERAQIKSDEGLKPEEKNAKINKLDRDLYNLLQANGWNIYADISGPQKYATWMLVKKLAKHFGLDEGKDVIAHNQADSKTLGEGENNMEFVRTMDQIEGKMPLLEGLMKRHGILPTGDLAFLLDYKKVLSLINSGRKLDPGHKDYPLVMNFFNSFYKNYDKMAAVFDAMHQGESLPFQDMLTQIQKLKAEVDAGVTSSQLPLEATKALLATFEISGSVKVGAQNGQLDRLVGWEDSVSLWVGHNGKKISAGTHNIGMGGTAEFSLKVGGLMPIRPGEMLKISIMDGSELVIEESWIPSDKPVAFKDNIDGPEYACQLRIRR